MLSEDDQRIMREAGTLAYPGLPAYSRVLKGWFKAELVRAFALQEPPGDWKLLLGCIVWGDYVGRFLDHTVASLLAPGNLPVLKDALIILHTDEGSLFNIIKRTVELRKYARLEIYIIPEEVLEGEKEHPSNKYWVFSTASNACMQHARTRGYAYHCMMPDHVYSCDYFGNIERLQRAGKRAIVQGALSLEMERVASVFIEKHHCISARDLAGMSLTYLHPQMEPVLMNGKEGFPQGLLMVMVGEKATYLNSPHMTPICIAHEVLLRSNVRVFYTNDTQLPFFIPDDVEPYVPIAKDQMTYCEISASDKILPARERVDFMNYCVRFWYVGGVARGHERFVRLTTTLTYPEGFVPPIAPMSDEAIARKQNGIWKAISLAFPIIEAVVPEDQRGDLIGKEVERLRVKREETAQSLHETFPDGIPEEFAELRRLSGRGLISPVPQQSGA